MDNDVSDGKLDGNILILMQNEKQSLQSLISILKDTKGIIETFILSISKLDLFYLCLKMNTASVGTFSMDSHSNLSIFTEMIHFASNQNSQL